MSKSKQTSSSDLKLRYNKRTKKRKYFPKKNNFSSGRANTGSYKKSTGLPETFSTDLKYFENGWVYSLPVGTVLDYQSIRINDPRDPYPSTGGKSALYYNFWMGVYRYCRVYAAKVTITWNKTQDNNSPVQFAMVPNWFSGHFADIDDVSSQPRAKVSRQLVNRVGGSESLSYYIKMSTALGMTDQQYNSQLPGSDYDCSNSSSPTKGAFLDIYYSRLADGASTEAVSGYFTVKIIFYVKFFQRYPIIESGFDAGDGTGDAGEIDKEALVLPDWVLPEDP